MLAEVAPTVIHGPPAAFPPIAPRPSATVASAVVVPSVTIVAPGTVVLQKEADRLACFAALRAMRDEMNALPAFSGPGAPSRDQPFATASVLAPSPPVLQPHDEILALSAEPCDEAPPPLHASSLAGARSTCDVSSQPSLAASPVPEFSDPTMACLAPGDGPAVVPGDSDGSAVEQDLEFVDPPFQLARRRNRRSARKYHGPKYFL